MPKSDERSDALRRIGSKLDRYKRKSAVRFEVDAAGRCERPQGFEHVARPEAGPDGYVAGLAQPAIIVAGDGRCRRCDPCLRARAALWRGRALTEMHRSTRTWFGTLTLTAANQLLYVNKCRANIANTKVLSGMPDFDALSAHEQFGLRCTAIGEEITKWLKRIRFNSGAELRYVIVAERHVSGDPHFHLLVHERAQPVKKRQLQEGWKLGFSAFKLCEGDRAAFYVTKYLTKSSAARVRASLRYGAEASAIAGGEAPGVRGKTPIKTDPRSAEAGSMPAEALSVLRTVL